MKKYVAFLLVLIIVIFSSCTSETVNGGGFVIRGQAPPTADIEACYKSEEIVYVTKSGAKYHKEGCPYLKSSSMPISLEQAQLQGLEPCSKCFPND